MARKGVHSEELKERMETFAVRARAIADLCDNEEQTKVSLINPYLEMLGYDVRDPRHVRLEVRGDIHTGNEKVDYAILRNGKPWMIIEAKKASVPLADGAPTTQVRRYAIDADVQYVAYTNGRHWRWFRKNANSGKLEDRPFIEHNVTEPEDREIRWLAGIHSSAWNADEVARIADEEGLQSAFVAWYKESRHNPSEAFLKLLLNAHGYVARTQMLERAAEAWKATLRAMESAQLNEASRRFRGESGSDDQQQSDEAAMPPSEDDSEEERSESDGPQLRWRYRWRVGSNQPWHYESHGRKAQLSIAATLFDGIGTSERSYIIERLNTPLADDNLRRETAYELHPGDVAARYCKAVGQSPPVAIYVNLSAREQSLWFARAMNARAALEVETDRGLRDPDTAKEHWPWEAAAT